MSQIKVINLSFSYDGSLEKIFENVSLILDTDWRLGFTGRNGRGKTTFLHLLEGTLEYSGTITSPVKFTYFPVAVETPDDITLNIIEGLRPDCEMWQLRRELNKLEIDEDILYQAYSTLSEGEKTKVLLASLFAGENNFLLIDEPTNHLDAHGREVVAEYLSKKSGFILVSHDRSFLDKCTDHTLSINKTNIEIMPGNFSDWLREKDRRDREEIAENEKLKREIKRLEKSAREKAEWSDRAERTKIGFDPTKTEKSMDRRAYIGEKSRKMMKRATVINARSEKAIEEKSALLKNIEGSESLKLHMLDYHSDRLALFDGATLFYKGDDGEIIKTACENVTFEIKKGERIALCGKNGCGKSTIIKLICGGDVGFTGRFEMSSGVKVSYVPQITSGLSGNLSDYAHDCGIDESLFKAILRKMDFSREQFETDMSEMSMGQKKKILLSRSLCERAHLFVWDEPLNYIDIFSRMQIEKLILTFQPTMLFVEHDADFVEKCADKIIAL